MKKNWKLCTLVWNLRNYQNAQEKGRKQKKTKIDQNFIEKPLKTNKN